MPIVIQIGEIAHFDLVNGRRGDWNVNLIEIKASRVTLTPDAYMRMSAWIGMVLLIFRYRKS
jgi:hypothetical protein